MTVDNKIVKMTFDNGKFQKDVSETMSALDKLKSSLNFDKSKASAAGLSDSFKKVDMSPISTQVDGVNAKFLAMAAIGTAALVGLASKAAFVGAQMISSLTIAPVIEGFKEYETNMNSVQTILANTQSKGTTLTDVNDALDEMNDFSDKTIYNFGQMATNVSKFTAAGVGLDESVSAIKGLANAAALAGVNNEDAQRSMFQLSQALGSGTVKLRDWMSVENSGMSTEQFRNALVQTGQALGEITNVPLGASLDEWQAKNGNFRDSLNDGWLTAEVLTTTLGAMAGDLDAVQLSDMGFSDEQVVKMVELGKTALASASDVKTATQLFSTLKETIASGWSNTFRLVVGDFVEAKQLFTGLNNFIGGFSSRASKAREELLTEWKTLGGRALLGQGLILSLGAIQKLLGAVTSAFREAFPKKTAAELVGMTQSFRSFAEKLVLTEDGVKRVKQIFGAFFSVIRIGVEIVKGIFRVAGALASVLFSIVGGFGGAAGSVGDFISKIREILVDKGGIEGFFNIIVGGIQRLGEVVSWVRDRLSGVFDFVGDKTGGVFSNTIDTVKNAFGGLLGVVGKLGGVKEVFSAIGQAWAGFISILKGGDFIGFGPLLNVDGDSKLVDTLSNIREVFLSLGDAWTGFISIMKGGDFIGFGSLLNVSEDSAIVDKLFDIREAFLGIGDAWAGFISIMKDGDFIGFGSLLKVSEDSAIVDKLFDIREGIISFYESITGIDVGSALSGIMDSIFRSFENFDILSLASTILTNIVNFFESLVNTVSGWTSVADVFADIQDAIGSFFTGMSNITKNAGASAGEGLNTFQDKISNFASNVWASIQSGLGPIGPALSSIFSAIGDVFDTAKAFISDKIDGIFGGISTAFETGNLTKILSGIGAGVAVSLARSLSRLSKDGLKFDFGMGEAVEGFVKAIDSLKGAIKSFQNNIRADTLLKIAVAMAVLAASIIALTFVDERKIAVSLGAVAVGIGTLVTALVLLSKIEANPAKTAALGLSVLLVAAAVLVLAAAVFVFGKMDPEVLKQGMISVGITLAGLTIMAVALSNASGSFIRAAIGVGILAGSLILFSFTINKFASMDLGSLGKAMAILVPMLLGFAVLSNIVDGDAIQKFSIGLGLVSLSLWGLSKVIERFGQMPTEEVVQGITAMATVLAMIVIAMRTMPDGDKAKASTIALLGMAAALWVMSKAVETVGKLATGEVIQSVLALVVVMGLMVAAALLMQNAQPGAYAMIILAAALAIFAGAIYLLGQLSLGEILLGLGAIAGLFIIFGVAGLLLGPVIPVLLAFGTAMLLIGAGAALFGIGLALIGAGLLSLSKVGPTAFENLGKGILEFIKVLPQIAAGLAAAFVEIIVVIGKSAGQIADAVGNLLIKLLEKVGEIAPVLGETIGILIETLLVLLEEKVPRIIEVGMILITAFLTGIRDNIATIVTLGIEIMANFLQGLADGIPLMGEAIRNLITAIVDEVILNIQLVIDAGVAIFVALLNGITSAIPQIVGAVGTMVVTFITELGKWTLFIIAVGTNMLVALIDGIRNNLAKIGDAVTAFFTDPVNGLFIKLESWWGRISDEGIELAKKLLEGLIDDAIDFAGFAGKMIVKILNGIEAFIRTDGKRIRDAARGVADALIDGLTGGLNDRVGDVVNTIRDVAGSAISEALSVFGINSPSRVFRDIGRGLNEGLVLGIRDTGDNAPRAVKGLADDTVKAFGAAMSGLKYDLQDLDDFNPTITPVLDLTQVSRDAKSLTGLLESTPISASISTARAQSLAVAERPARETQTSAAEAESTNIVFEQNNYSPKALSANDIYRGTRSQIATAKEALGIV